MWGFLFFQRNTRMNRIVHVSRLSEMREWFTWMFISLMRWYPGVNIHLGYLVLLQKKKKKSKRIVVSTIASLAPFRDLIPHILQDFLQYIQDLIPKPMFPLSSHPARKSNNLLHEISRMLAVEVQVLVSVISITTQSKTISIGLVRDSGGGSRGDRLLLSDVMCGLRLGCCMNLQGPDMRSLLVVWVFWLFLAGSICYPSILLKGRNHISLGVDELGYKR